MTGSANLQKASLFSTSHKACCTSFTTARREVTRKKRSSVGQSFRKCQHFSQMANRRGFSEMLRGSVTRRSPVFAAWHAEFFELEPCIACEEHQQCNTWHKVERDRFSPCLHRWQKSYTRKLPVFKLSDFYAKIIPNIANQIWINKNLHLKIIIHGYMLSNLLFK